jgi:3-oxoacyl-[acyl-carrier protein] reductase
VGHQEPLTPVALVTGSSRGIGAETARLLSRQLGARVGVNYRDKRRRADQVVAAIAADGGQALALQADLTDPAATAEMLGRVKASWGRIDVLVLNAPGGMERDVDPGYALRLNRDAQVSLVEQAMELM